MNMLKLFLWAVFIQVFVLNNIQFSGYVNPYYYIIFILYIPSKQSKTLNLLLCFILGFSVDVFSQSYGAHAFASVLIGYIKLFFLGKTSINKDTDEIIEFKNIPIDKFIVIACCFIIIHHFTLFFLERFNLNEILSVLKMTILSTIFTLFLFIVHQLFISKKYEKI